VRGNRSDNDKAGLMALDQLRPLTLGELLDATFSF
jgi:hypothetical protein